jgi:hypothetical protein
MRRRTQVRVHTAAATANVLERWKKKSAARVAHLKEQLSKVPTEPAKLRARQDWLDRMDKALQGRTQWLEARLEHARAVALALRQAKDKTAGEGKTAGSSVENRSAS